MMEDGKNVLLWLANELFGGKVGWLLGASCEMSWFRGHLWVV